MPLGTSMFLIALGAILRYAVTASVSGLSLPTIGLILMIVGIAGVVLSLLYMLSWSGRRGAVVREHVEQREHHAGDPNDHQDQADRGQGKTRDAGRHCVAQDRA